MLQPLSSRSRRLVRRSSVPCARWATVFLSTCSAVPVPASVLILAPWSTRHVLLLFAAWPPLRAYSRVVHGNHRPLRDFAPLGRLRGWSQAALAVGIGVPVRLSVLLKRSGRGGEPKPCLESAPLITGAVHGSHSIELSTCCRVAPAVGNLAHRCGPLLLVRCTVPRQPLLRVFEWRPAVKLGWFHSRDVDIDGA